jgi:hypothetical protein
MKLKEAQTVKKQLQQLDVELRRFKAELLTARVAEIEKAIRRPAGRTHLLHVRDHGEP